MATSIMTIRMESDIKANFEELCTTLGLTVNTAINIFVRESIRTQRLNLSLNASDNNVKMSAEEAYKLTEKIIFRDSVKIPADETGLEFRMNEKYGL